MRGLKIVVLGTRGFPGVQGGVESHCEQLYPRLADLGCDVTVITRSPYISAENRSKEWSGVKFIHLWAPKNKCFEAIAHTFFGVIAARLMSPDILHIHAIGPSIMVFFAKMLGLKVVVTNHGPDYERRKWGWCARLTLKAGEFFGTRFADKVIVISEGIKKILREKYGRNDLELVPNGVERSEFCSPNGTLKKYNLEQGKYVFTACRFVPEKGLHDLIEAYGRIRDPDFKLVIAGDADHETEYSRRIKAMAKGSDGVTLTGFISGRPLKELYSNSGLFVLPSYHEGLPIALLEALSYELPVLLSDIPANKEVHLPESRYFHMGNVAELSGNMARLLHEGIGEEEKEQNRNMLREKYNWDSISKRIHGIYLSV